MDSKSKRKQFWEQQAIDHGADVKAVNFDPHLEEMSTKAILKLIPDGLVVADIGCGNGILTAAIARNCPGGTVVGYDASQSMIDVAKENKESNLVFGVRDYAVDHELAPLYDIVICRRLLINLNFGEKMKALNNIRAMLKRHGKFIMCECWQYPLNRINEMRKALGYDPIPVRSVNEYLDQPFASELFLRFQPIGIAPITYGSLYYFISRVFNADGDYDAPINLMAKKLIESGLDPLKAEYGFCPESIWELRPR